MDPFRSPKPNRGQEARGSIVKEGKRRIAGERRGARRTWQELFEPSPLSATPRPIRPLLAKEERNKNRERGKAKNQQTREQQQKKDDQEPRKVKSRNDVQNRGRQKERGGKRTLLWTYIPSISQVFVPEIKAKQQLRFPAFPFISSTLLIPATIFSGRPPITTPQAWIKSDKRWQQKGQRGGRRRCMGEVMTWSLVASVKTSGVCETIILRFLASSRSILSTPTAY